MKLADLLGQRRLILTVAVMATALGVRAWFGMPRQEDPPVANLRALVITPYAGADAETVERLVLHPIEERLAEVPEIRHVTSQARAGVAVTVIELEEQVDTEAVWDEVARALADARTDLPEGASAPDLDRHYYDQESIVLAVTGSNDRLELREAAERVKRALLGVSSVARVIDIADPGEQISVEYDEETARRLGMSPAALARLLETRTSALAGGTVRVDSRTLVVRPEEDLQSAGDLARAPIGVSTGAVPLETIARVRREPLLVESARMRVNGEHAVGLGIVPKAGIDRVRFGEAVRRVLEATKPSVRPLEIVEVAYQPFWVERRIDDLAQNLVQGGIIVAGLLILFLSMRLGLVVSAVLPVVIFVTIAVYAVGGGILHQVSVAALIISLGNAIDNAVVIAEDIQSRIDAGEVRREAATATIRQLAVPLASSTGTTMCAFLPMLLAGGAVAEFTRAIPVIMIITLTVSYAVCLLLTPLLSEMFLRRRASAEDSRFLAWTKLAADSAMARPRTVLVLSVVAVVLTGLLFPFVPIRFFPASERTQLLVDVELPEGSAVAETDGTVASIETAAKRHPAVVRVASFIGRGAPRFYYNIPPQPRAPHVAQLLVETRDRTSMDSVLAHLRRVGARHPEAFVVARRIEQGPPVRAPIEIRLYGPDLAGLETAAQRVLAEVRAVPGTRDARHTVGVGVPVLDFHVEDFFNEREGNSRMDIALGLLGRTRGIAAGEVRSGTDPVPVVVRSSFGEDFPVAQLGSMDIAHDRARPQRIDQIARSELGFRPASIAHRDRSRYVSVLAQLRGDVTAAKVMRALEPRIRALRLPPGVTFDIGGDKANSGEANESLKHELPLSMLLLCALILLEFNSFRRMAIVLVTIPLSIGGIVPALFVSGRPFSFFALLGSLALIGIVVNNAILLIDFIENRRKEGATVADAVRDAVHLRTRPVMLTAGVTIVGLFPMCFSDSDLWPPLAIAMVGGLVASTALALFVVPILYLLSFRKEQVDVAVA